VGDEHRYREIFVPDSGTLLDIFVFDVTADHWQSLLTFLSANYELVYLEDGCVVSPCPDFGTIWKRTAEKAITLKVLLPEFTANMHFFVHDQIEIDVLPEDIDCREKADAVFMLMKCIARVLAKEVFMVRECGSCTDEELRQMAVCSCDPINADIRLHEDLFGQ
jgi:hypothetical protein